MRDLKADRELCNKATPGPWLLESDDYPFHIVDFAYVDVMAAYCARDDVEFIIQAREGWPHAIERAIKAEKQLEELLAWEKPKEKCYLSAMRRIAELESLVRELVDALDFMLGDKSTRTDWLVEMGKTYSKAKEVLR